MSNIQQLETQEIVSSLGDISNKFKDNTVLVLGCGGFLGSVFTQYFLEVGAKVVGMDNFIIGVPKIVINNPNFTFFNHDVCQSLLEKLHGIKIDWIVNCCGIADPRIYSKYPEECMEISHSGTKNVLQLARERQVKGTLCFSSSEIYGDPFPEFIPTKEDYNGNCSTTGDRAMYDEYKRALETLCSVHNRKYGVNVKIVRPFNTYSSYMSLKDNRILSSCMRNILEGKTIKLYKPASETRTFCYATDFIDGAIRILTSEKSFDIYNCGNDTPEISMKDLVDLVIEITKTTVGVELVDPPAVYKIQPQRRCPNIDKLRKLGYSPKISLAEGIERYYNWAKENYRNES